MWVFLRDSFLAITEHEAESRLLDVRARIRGDIEKVFPEADVVETIEGDYRFRTALPRERVAQAMSLRTSKVNYVSFEDATEGAERRLVHHDVWNVMFDEQNRRYGPPTLDVDGEEKPLPRYVLEDPRYDITPPADEPLAQADQVSGQPELTPAE
jgi:hypothetical protein